MERRKTTALAPVLLVLCVLLLLVGCGSETATPTAIPTAPALATSTGSTPAPTHPVPTTAPAEVPATATSVATLSPTQAPVVSLGNLEVHFIDVGQGDAILILGPDGKAALIDGGEAGSGALQYLRGKGVQKLDLMVATHPHADHIGGLVEILQGIPVAQVVTNGQPHTTRTYENFLDAIASAKAQYVEVKRGDSLPFGDLKFNVLHPISNTGANLNDQSVVLRLEHGQMSFLFAGDAERDAEAAMVMSSSGSVSAKVLKVGHHGSRTASSQQFLAAVKPEVAVYSAGAGNTYGHPHAEALAALASVGAKVYGTDVNGTIVITSDGSGYVVTTTRAGEPRAPPGAVSLPPTVAPASASVPAAALSLDLVSLTSPASRGANATLVAKTAPGANCKITVYYKSGPSKAQGLEPKVADGSGNVSWTWKVGASTTPGTWRIVVTSSLGGDSVTSEYQFVVQ